MGPALTLAWCSHAAAQYAVLHWHYARSMPTPPVVKIGVWEHGQYVGCVLFSRGANRHLGGPYGLRCTAVAELSRVALAPHQTPTSRIVRIAMRLVAQHAPGLRLLVSYADPNHGHHGGLYQALGWLYVGQTAPSVQYIDARGRAWHPRQVSADGVKPQYGTLRRVPKSSECRRVPQRGKHKYLWPLDPALRPQLLAAVQPYPKRARSIQDAPPVQGGEGEAASTLALPLAR